MIVAQPDHRYEADEQSAWVLQSVDAWRTKTERLRRDPGKFHPSDLGQDDEAIIARFRGEQVERDEDRDPVKLRIFDTGHSMHRRWGGYLRKCGLTVKHTKSFYIPRLRLRGTCDEIIAAPVTGDAHIVELKSINPFAFSKLSEPKPDHVDQLHCYLVGLRIPRGILLYECKGTQSVKVFTVPFDRGRWLLIEQRLIRLRRDAESRTRWEERQTPEVAAAATDLRDLLTGQDQRRFDA
jgi:hypothetical protein